MVRLFHPRRDRWPGRFLWAGPILMGVTPIGRATVRVLAINEAAAVELRRTLIDGGEFHPRR